MCERVCAWVCVRVNVCGCGCGWVVWVVEWLHAHLLVCMCNVALL